jgi:hypothetical protein
MGAAGADEMSVNLATAVEFHAELARLQAVIDSLQQPPRSEEQEVLEQRLEIAGLREERRAILDADRPQMDTRLAE